MRRAAFLLLAGALAAPLAAQEASTDSARPIGLDEAFALALKRSETIATSSDAVAYALARVDELVSHVLPQISLVGSQMFQENPNASVAAINQTSLQTAQITLTQPLFSGFREFLAYKAGKLQARARDMDERRAESLLYQDVAQAYYDLLRLRREMEIRRSIIEATRDRVRQLEAWIKIGRARSSEALAARSQTAQVEAQLELARAQERVSQETLKFLTGLDTALAPRETAVPSPGTPEPYLEQARKRQDVVGRERDLDAARFNTEIFRRQRWPTIGLTGDYYLKRPGFFSSVHWDALIAATLPLYTGGQIGAQVREAAAQEDQARQALSLAQRGAERDVLASFRNMEGTLDALRALDRAADLAEANVRAQTDDYRLGLVTNLDVLDALTTLENTRLTQNQTRQQAGLSEVQLKVAAGALP